VIPLAVPNVSGREAAYLQECIDSTFVSSVGPFVERFESLVAEAAGSAGAVAVSSGTTGLHLALHTLGVRAGDLVALPSLTFIASANAVAHCGATPWLFDVDDGSWTIDVEQLADTFRRDLEPGDEGPIHQPTGRRVAAIVPVHALGHPADMDAIIGLAGAYDVPVVADAAAALGALYRGRAIGGTGAEASVFSFNGNKTVTAGGGGAIVSDDEDFLRRARHLSTTARVGPGYDHDAIGFNYRMTNLQAAVGCAQMERLDEFVAVKRRCQAAYADAVAGIGGAVAFPRAAWAESACWFAGFWLPDWEPHRVEALRAQLRADGIDARPFWTPMYHQRPYAHAPAEPQTVTDGLWSRVVTLPCSTGITDGELGRVVEIVRGRLAS
jgi:perosamine synthetase